VLWSEVGLWTLLQISSKDEDFLDLSVDVEQNTSITHCLRSESTHTHTHTCKHEHASILLSYSFSYWPLIEVSVIQRPCAVSINITVRNAEVNRRHTKGTHSFLSAAS